MANPYCLDMATDAPTILATSGGYRDHDRLRFQFADLLHYAVDLSGTSGVVPRVCNVSTASGDDPRFQMDMSEAGRVAGFNLTHLSLFSMPNLDDIEGHRRSLVHRLVADGTLGTTHCTDAGVGMLYRGTDLVEAVTEQAGKGAYIVRRDGDHAVEERLETRLLAQRSAQTPAGSAKSVTWQR